MADKQIYELDPKTGKHKALPFNPLRGRAVVANSTNTKAYGVRPFDMGQESVGIRKVGAQLVTHPKEVCDLSKDFTILRFVNISEIRVTDSTPLIRKLNGINFFADSISLDRLILRFGNISGDAWQSEESIDTNFSSKYKSKYIFVAIVKLNLNISIFINNILVKSCILSENVGNNNENFVDYLGGTTNVLDLVTKFFNYALTPSDIAYYWNNGRPDLAIVRDRDKWGSNAE